MKNQRVPIANDCDGPGYRSRKAEAPLIDVQNLGIWFRLTQNRSKSSLSRYFLDGLRRKSPLLWALRNVSLKCYQGQTIGVIGHNGAGKSTLCLALAQILQPDEGTVDVRGKVSTIVSLGAGLNTQLSGRDNIRLYAALMGFPPAELDERLDDIIDFTELGPFIDEPIAHYSTGMRARLAFAVATSMQPEILILDEVFAVGDPPFRAKSKKRIGELMEQSKLIFVVSHYLAFIRQVTTHCLWLDHGTVRAFGPTGQILAAYAREMGCDESEAA